MDNTRGAYCEVGRDELCDGAPNPDMPETLYRLLEEVERFGRFGRVPVGRAGGPLEVWGRLEVEREMGTAGGVVEPYVEFRVEDEAPLDPPMLESVLLSVMKLALDRLRRSFKNEGAMVVLIAVAAVEGSCGHISGGGGQEEW
jgi:hypothetical protein